MTFSDVLDEIDIAWVPSGTNRHVRPGWQATNCHRCSPGSGKWKLGWAINGRMASCWSCGKISFAEILVEAGGLSWHRAKELLKGLTGGFAPLPVKATGKLRLPPGVGPLLKPHRNYLRGRGFDPRELVALWGIGGIGLAAKHPWTIFVPVEAGGKVVSWTTRTLSGEGQRWNNAKPEDEAVRAKDLLYAESMAGHGIVVVEGATDCWRVGPGAVATMGLKYTQEQVARIARHPSRAICFDNEPAAKSVARRLADELSCFPGKTLVVEMDADDPGSASKKEVESIRKAFLT